MRSQSARFRNKHLLGLFSFLVPAYRAHDELLYVLALGAILPPHRGKLLSFPLIACFTLNYPCQASKIIMFNTAPGHALGVHFGALCGVIGVNVIGLSLAVWFERWRDERSARKERKKKEEDEEKEKRGREEGDRGESGQ